MPSSPDSTHDQDEFFDADETQEPQKDTENEVNEEGEAGSAIAGEYRSAFRSFVKTLASFTGDLSQLTCPAFLLSGVSLLEYSVHWADHPDLFAAIPKVKDPAERLVAVTRWFVSTLYGSYMSRSAGNSTEKKPFNPVLGEQFLCSWPADKGRELSETRMFCEQVCHHPPISAFYIENSEAGIYLNGHCGQKSKFKATSIKVEQTGRVVVVLIDGSDEYLVSYPDLSVRGILSGKMFVELSGISRIASRSGFVAEIEYIPKPWFSGNYHHIKGSMYKVGEDKKPIYTFSGRWPFTSHLTNSTTGETNILFDADSFPLELPFVKAIPEQADLESRRLWEKVADAISSQNYSLATKEKTEIEETQRTKRKERKQTGEEWAPKYFKFVEDNSDLAGIDFVMKKTSSSMSVSGKKKDDKNGMDTGAWMYLNRPEMKS